MTLESAALRVGSSVLSLQAQVTNYGNPLVEGHYDLHIHAQDFAAMAKPVVPAGDLALSGKLHYQGSVGEPLVREILLDGQIASEEITAASAQGRVDLRRLQGRYELANGTLQAHDVTFETLGGRLSTDAKLEHLDSTVAAQVKTTLRGISLPAVQHSLRQAEIKGVTLAGRVDGSVTAAWTGSVSDVQARGDLTVNSASHGVPPGMLASTGEVGRWFDSCVLRRSTCVSLPFRDHLRCGFLRRPLECRDRSAIIPICKFWLTQRIFTNSRNCLQLSAASRRKLRNLEAARRSKRRFRDRCKSLK